MTENIEDIIKTAKENNYNPMDMVIASNIMLIDQLKEKIKERGGHIDFPTELGQHPYMIFISDDICEVMVKKVYVDDKDNIKIDGWFVSAEYTETFDIDDFALGQIHNVLLLIED